MPNRYVSSRTLQRSFASLRSEDGVMVVMDRSTPRAIMVPFDDETFRLLDERQRNRAREQADYATVMRDVAKHGGHSSDEVRSFLRSRAKKTTPHARKKSN